MADTPDTAAGAKLSIGTTAEIDYATSEAAALADFESESPWTEILNVSNIGEFGSSANILKFPVLSDSYVPKSKGTRDAGDPAIVVGRIPDDPGQLLVRAAEKTKFYYNFKLELEDARSALYTNTVIYFRALVAGVPNQIGGNEDFVTETYALGVYPQPIYDNSHLASP